jgi:hypothetical protein
MQLASAWDMILLALAWDTALASAWDTALAWDTILTALAWDTILTVLAWDTILTVLAWDTIRFASGLALGWVPERQWEFHNLAHIQYIRPVAIPRSWFWPPQHKFLRSYQQNSQRSIYN